MKEKKHINISTMGHVGHGKSTLMGYLLRQLNVVTDGEMRQIEAEAREHKQVDRTFAWVFQKGGQERFERKISMVRSYRSFSTEKYDFMVIDCPGHKDFLRTMIIGTTQADAGILVISAAENEFKDAFMGSTFETRRTQKYVDGKARGKIVQEWVAGQALEHVYVAKALDIDQLIVVISKMDEISWNKSKYLEIQNRVVKLLKAAKFLRKGFEPIFVPVGGKVPNEYGVNVITRNTELVPWYDGPTFLESLNTLVPPPRPMDLALRIPIEDYYEGVPGTEIILSGRVESGKVAVGQQVIVQPGDGNASVRSIKIRDEKATDARWLWPEVKEAVAGDIVSLGLRSDEIQEWVGRDLNLRGRVISKIESPARASRKASAEIFVLWHPKEIKREYGPTIHVGTDALQGFFEDLKSRTDPRTNKTESNPESLKAGDVAEVSIRFEKPVVIDLQVNRLSRLVIHDHGLTVAGGKIRSAE